MNVIDLRFNVEGSESEMVFVIVHLQLQKDPEEVLHVSGISVDQDVVNLLSLDLFQDSPASQKK